MGAKEKYGQVQTAGELGWSRGSRSRTVSVSGDSFSMRRVLRSPSVKVAEAIADALDPTRVPGRVRLFRDMSPEEQAHLRRLYEKP